MKKKQSTLAMMKCARSHQLWWPSLLAQSDHSTSHCRRLFNIDHKTHCSSTLFAHHATITHLSLFRQHFLFFLIFFSVHLANVFSETVYTSDSLPSTSYSNARPIPFSPDYRPECDLILPRSSKSSFRSSTTTATSTQPIFHYGASYFTNQLDNSPQDLLSNGELSSYYPTQYSSNSAAQQYLSSIAPRFV